MVKAHATSLLCAALFSVFGHGSYAATNDFFPLPTEVADVNRDTSNNGSAQSSCPLNCLNGSNCTRGDQNTHGHPMYPISGLVLSFHKELNRDGWHCDCADGYSGLACQTAFRTCTDGEHVCYHGGTCKTGSVENNDFYGTGVSYCDCRTAVDPENSLIEYSGTYCEEASSSVQACDKERLCLNGGTCQEDEEVPCSCQDGYFGRNCEYVREVKSQCQKPCSNGGECKFVDNNVTEEYCECVQSRYGEFCDNTAEKCGDDKYCHNGGKCFEIQLSSGIKEHLCDCTRGYTDEFYYSGEYCQYPSTAFCSDHDDPNGRQFCTNEGECPDDPHKACTCPPGFSGPRCAFQNDLDGLDYAECQLGCKNGGTCQKGLKDLEEVQSKFSHDVFNETHSDFEHCVCPEGFYGIRCEYKMEQCASHGHVCLHGSTCIRFSDAESCNCEDADHPTAGIYCEFFATEECDAQTIASVNPGQDHRGFCTNDGLCIVIDGSMACSCPAGFEGPHCEYKVDEDNSIPTIVEPPTEMTTGTGVSTTGKLFIVISVFATSGIAIWYVLFYPRWSFAARRTQNGAGGTDNLAVGEDSDSDLATRVRTGTGLTAVDLI